MGKRGTRLNTQNSNPKPGRHPSPCDVMHSRDGGELTLGHLPAGEGRREREREDNNYCFYNVNKIIGGRGRTATGRTRGGRRWRGPLGREGTATAERSTPERIDHWQDDTSGTAFAAGSNATRPWRAAWTRQRSTRGGGGWSREGRGPGMRGPLCVRCRTRGPGR